MMPGGPRLGLTEARRASQEMRLYRARHGLSQEAFAAVLGTPASWVKAREEGSTRLRVGHAEQIAAAMGTDLPGLTGGAS